MGSGRRHGRDHEDPMATEPGRCRWRTPWEHARAQGLAPSGRGPHTAL